MKRIATKEVKNVIMVEKQVKTMIKNQEEVILIKTAYRKIQNPTKKEIAIGIANKFPNSEIFYNQTGGKIYYNIYIPVKM